MVIDAKHMDSAIEEAKLAFSKGETPVGAVVVCGDEILARAHNAVEASGDPTMHAELIALKAACSIKGRFLTDCTLYVTMEPCPIIAVPKDGWSMYASPVTITKSGVSTPNTSYNSAPVMGRGFLISIVFIRVCL